MLRAGTKSTARTLHSGNFLAGVVNSIGGGGAQRRRIYKPVIVPSAVTSIRSAAGRRGSAGIRIIWPVSATR